MNVNIYKYICSCSFPLASTTSSLIISKITLCNALLWWLFTCLRRLEFGAPGCLLKTLCPGQLWQIMPFSTSPSTKNCPTRSFMHLLFFPTLMYPLVANFFWGPSLTCCKRANGEQAIEKSDSHKWQIAKITHIEMSGWKHYYVHHIVSR